MVDVSTVSLPQTDRQAGRQTDRKEVLGVGLNSVVGLREEK